MIHIKNKMALAKMRDAGQRLALVMNDIIPAVVGGVTTAALDAQLEARMRSLDLAPACKGFKGYRHVSCISVNDIWCMVCRPQWSITARILCDD